METFQIIQDKINGKKRKAVRKTFTEDFLLRGFVTCAGCDKPLTGAWSKGRSQHYGYYKCQQKECTAYGKSIPKAKMENEFGELLKSMRPSQNLSRLAHEMFKDMWDELGSDAEAEKNLLKQKARELDKELAKFLDRAMEANSPTMVRAYEKRIQDIENEQLIIQEKIAKCGAALPDFDKTYRTAMRFLSNPYEMWVSKEVANKITVAKLVFPNKVPYCKNEGYRTAPIAEPFRLLRVIEGSKKEMVPRGGLEPPRP